MGHSTSDLRQAWHDFECREDKMSVIDFGPDRIKVVPTTVDAWHALASVMLAHGYKIRTADTDSYNCREIKGGGGKSLHSYGIALDVNWTTNPFQLTPDNRAVRFSNKSTQDDRANDVRLHIADTDMTEAMIADILAIKTKGGKQVFEWGGGWPSRKDAMHFELDVTPDELVAGIDFATVKAPAAGAPISSGEDRGAIGDLDDDGVLRIGSRGDRVIQLQNALKMTGLDVGKADGIFGAVTEQAVKNFQIANGLNPSGEVDVATGRALGQPSGSGSANMSDNNVIGALIEAALKRPAGTAGSTSTPAQPDPAQVIKLLAGLLANAQQPGGTAPASGNANILATVLAALGGKANATAADGAQTPILSPIDKLLGGEALAGKKSLISVLGLVITLVMQFAGAMTPGGATANIVMTLLGGLGGAGVLAKIDRVVQALGIIAAKK